MRILGFAFLIFSLGFGVAPVAAVEVSDPQATRPRKARIAIKPPLLRGPCKAPPIRKQIEGRRAALLDCYEAALPKHPALRGSWIGTWMINLQGRVVHLNSRGSLKSRQVRSCVDNVIGRIRFSAPKGATCAVRLPIRFWRPGPRKL